MKINLDQQTNSNDEDKQNNTMSAFLFCLSHIVLFYIII